MKKAWINQFHEGSDLVSLSIESDGIEPENIVAVTQSTFPVEPPHRHVIVLGLFSSEDINKLAQCLDLYRTDSAYYDNFDDSQ